MANTDNIMKAAVSFSYLPIARQISLLVGLSASIAIAIAVVLWSQEPAYSPLSNDISTTDAGEVVDMLRQSNIDYKIDQKHGTILVRETDVHDARMKLAARGLPKSQETSLDTLARENTFGTSQLIESARYRQSLEMELARTISSFHTIKAARVHLAIPKGSAFLRDQEKPSASVFIDLYSGSSISSEKVASIIHLVASSIPGMNSSDVTVVDNQGNLLTDQEKGPEIASANRFLKYRNQVEELYVDKIQDILIPVLGAGKVRARVTADLDFTTVEQTMETFNPDLPSLRSEQSVQETQSNDSGSVGGGVPGSLSNQPPATPAPGNSSSTPSPDKSGENNQNLKSQMTRNYELDKTISHTQKEPGTIKRLTVAVIVDDKMNVDDKSKKVTYKPLSKDDIEKIKILVKDAIGFNPQRGDSVSVINSAFAKAPPMEPLPEIKIWQQDWVKGLVKQVTGGLFVLLMVFGVLRPILKSLANKPVQVVENSNNTNTMIPAGGVNTTGFMQQNNSFANQILRNASSLQSHEERMQVVQGLASTDPKRVAQVVKTWVDGVK